MRFPWRTSENDPQQKLHCVDTLVQDIDATPVAMFSLINGNSIGLSMEDIGELVENHNELLACTVLPAAERKLIEREVDVAREGAALLCAQFNMQFDDRLRPPAQHHGQETSPEDVGAAVTQLRRIAISRRYE